MSDFTPKIASGTNKFKSADTRFHREAVRKMFVEIREKMEQARARSRYERLEGGERRHQEIETGAISWRPTPEDAKAFYALHRYGWDRLRIQVELTSALASHGKDLVRKLLRDLVSQARVECGGVQPDVDPTNSETFREELRLASGCPYSRRKCRSRAKEQFVQEMLAAVPPTEANLDWRWLDPVPNWLALEVAVETLVKPGEFLLWDPRGVSFFSALSPDGTRRAGEYALLDRGDRVNVYPLGFTQLANGSPAHFDFTGEVTSDGRLQMPTGPNPIHSVLSPDDVPEVLWENHGEDLFELYFGRVDRIQYEPLWSPAWVAEVEDRLCDMAAESADSEDADNLDS
jgi:hypothetical protein